MQNFDATLEFIVREGISASLRAYVSGPGRANSLFCLVDIVEDIEGRWLSVCFYADTVADPDEKGNLVPKGLLGEDGYCFDVDGADLDLEEYLRDTMIAARNNVLAAKAAHPESI